MEKNGRIVSPPVDQLGRLRQPLTSGEWMVFKLFDSSLSVDWEIYIQPHLNGLRPDFVLLNPRAGIAVFEVKDWDFAAMTYFTKEREFQPPKMMATKNSKTFSVQHQNPVDKVLLYKNELHGLYCPRLEGKHSYSVITAGVIFPFAEDEDAWALCKPCHMYHELLDFSQYNPISGATSVRSGDIDRVFPEHSRLSSKFMGAATAADLRNWLVEPDVSAKQRAPLELDSNQLALVTSRTASGYRRIKGPAGSGKSLVLAARAAELIREGKEVLVVTYNITLLHYLMDLAVRWPSSSGGTRKAVTWLNFHSWCKRVCYEADALAQYYDLWGGDEDAELSQVNDDMDSDTVLDKELPELVSALLDNDKESLVARYDAVLVDEGQDFLPGWWNALRKVCRHGGEMLLVADATQDVYGKARAWTDEAMTGAGFPGGRWAELKVSYRLPPTALRYAREFARHFLPADLVDLPESRQGELDIFPCDLKWVHVQAGDVASVCVSEVLEMLALKKAGPLAVADITILSENRHDGLEIVKKLGQKGIKAIHTFAKDSHAQRKK